MAEIIFMGFGERDVTIDLTGKTPEQILEEMTK